MNKLETFVFLFSNQIGGRVFWVQADTQKIAKFLETNGWWTHCLNSAEVQKVCCNTNEEEIQII